jgi:hypothetical protein
MAENAFSREPPPLALFVLPRLQPDPGGTAVFVDELSSASLTTNTATAIETASVKQPLPLRMGRSCR